ncbi:uncharacterized protein BDV17DRAFT_100924 [Aspergillus undulatus]|uniref:uncharacterized protein n=1 Tax=Aspergillus undulatus TaxID=1810928 RepID=UPI003CCD70EE
MMPIFNMGYDNGRMGSEKRIRELPRTLTEPYWGMLLQGQRHSDSVLLIIQLVLFLETAVNSGRTVRHHLPAWQYRKTFKPAH